MTVTVFERNKPDDTFGWGVVLSAETLDNLTRNDPVSAVWIRRYFAYWDDIAVIHKGVRTVSTGHGFCGIGRKRLLMLLAAARPRARHQAQLRDRGRRPEDLHGDRTIWSSPPTA